MVSESLCKANHEKELKKVTPKQMLQKLKIALAQVKGGKNSETLLNQIKQTVYFLYQSKDIAKKVYIIESKQIKNGYYIYEHRKQ